MEISEVTRLAIMDELSLCGAGWAGRLEEPDFLARIYDMGNIGSTDGRFRDAYGDVYQHRVNNDDWADDWVFTDGRFGLQRGDDEVFLRFLAETVHPVVRPDDSEIADLVAMYNRHLRADGYELAEVTQISGRPIHGPRSIITVPPALRDVERAAAIADLEYLNRQIARMAAAVQSDPELAIGTAKELVETSCKTILVQDGVASDPSWDLARLLKETTSALRLKPADVAPTAAAADTIRRVLGSLGILVAGIAELRNAYGTGHGKAAGASALGPRHARLAVGAASTLAVFLFETHEDRRSRAVDDRPTS